jgi:hypothetical protein
MGVYMREHRDSSWDELKLADKLKLINLFSPLALLGNIL